MWILFCNKKLWKWFFAGHQFWSIKCVKHFPRICDEKQISTELQNIHAEIYPFKVLRWRSKYDFCNCSSEMYFVVIIFSTIGCFIYLIKWDHQYECDNCWFSQNIFVKLNIIHYIVNQQYLICHTGAELNPRESRFTVVISESEMKF